MSRPLAQKTHMVTPKLFTSALVACGLLLAGPALATSSAPDANVLCGGGKKTDDKKKDRDPAALCGDMGKKDGDKKKKNPA